MASAPEPPDPMETAQAQSGMNRDTALTQAMLNMTNQVTPYGNLTYKQTGTSKFKDSQGNWVSTPTYTATTTLTPQQQAILDQTQGAQLNLATLGKDRSAFLQDYLKQDFNVDAAAEQKLYDLGASRLDPRFEQQRDQLQTRLISQGIRPGTEAYERQMMQFEQGRNDAYNSLALSGRSQAFNEALTERNQPLNEISALLSGSQVQQPNFVNTPQTSVGGVDYTGLVNSNYQAQVANQNSMLGGLFGLGAAGIGLFSDERLKVNITRIGETDSGIPLYRYQYAWGGPYHIGVLAHEAERFIPDAVYEVENGYKAVDYGKVN